MTATQFQIDGYTLHGRMQMLNELTEQQFPLTNTRLVNLLSKCRGWQSLTYKQKEIAVNACEDRRDEDTLKRAIKIAKRTK